MNKLSLNAGKCEHRHFMHRAMKSTPWLICASAACLTLVPCEMAFADDNPELNTDNTKSGQRGVQLVIDDPTDKNIVGDWATSGDATDGIVKLDGATVINNTKKKYHVIGGWRIY